jgi:O-antigen/teichoic acid export membrane protein
VDGSEIKHKTFHAVFWTIIREGGLTMITFATFIVLARVLSPKDYGVYALVMFVIELSKIISYVGLPSVVLQDTTEDWVLADTAFWGNTMLGCIMAFLVWITTPLYANLVGQPEVIPIMHVLALTLPISGLPIVHWVLMERNFGHKSITKRTLVGNTIASASAIIAALSGCGVWSFVIYTLVYDVVLTLSAWQAFPWLPRLRFDWRKLWQIKGYAGSLLLPQFLTALLTRAQDVIIARTLSVVSVGVYRIAWRMIDLICQVTMKPMVEVGFVTLSKLQDNEEKFGTAFLRMLGLGLLISVPAITGFGFLAADIIVLLFGDKWTPSVDVVEILSLTSVPFCLNLFTTTALSSMGESVATTKMASVQAVTTLSALMVAARFGLHWIAVAYVVRSYLLIPYNLSLFRKKTDVSYRYMAKTVAPPVIATVMMTGVMLGATPFLHQYLGHGIVYLMVTSLTGAISYFASLTIFSRDYVRSNMNVLIPLFRGQAA